MGGVLGEILGGIIGGIVGLIIPAVKTTILFGGDAIFCGGGNALANVATGLCGAGAYGSYFSYILDIINGIINMGDAVICGIGNWIANAFTGMLGAAGVGAGGIGTMVGASGWFPAIIGVASGVGGGILNAMITGVSYLWPIVTSAIAAMIGLIPLI